MSSKKPAKKGGAKKDDNGFEEKLEGLRGQLKVNQVRLAALERYLVLRNEQIERTTKEKNEIIKKLSEIEDKFEKEKEIKFNAACKMIQQHKLVKGDLKQKVDALVEDKKQMENQMKAKIHQLEQEILDKNSVLSQKDQEIEIQKQKIDNLVSEFGTMLKSTLTKMGERIVNPS